MLNIKYIYILISLYFINLFFSFIWLESLVSKNKLLISKKKVIYSFIFINMIGNLPAFSFFFFKFLTLVSLPFYFSLYLYLLFVYSNTYIVYSYYINFRKLFLKKQNLILYKLYKKYSELKSDFLISMLISYCIISLSFPFFIDFLFI